MASGPITSWQIDEETMETVTDFIFLGSKITVDGDCSHEIILIWKKSYDKPNSIKKKKKEKAETLLWQQRCHSQSYGFSSNHVLM